MINFREKLNKLKEDSNNSPKNVEYRKAQDLLVKRGFKNDDSLRKMIIAWLNKGKNAEEINLLIKSSHHSNVKYLESFNTKADYTKLKFSMPRDILLRDWTKIRNWLNDKIGKQGEDWNIVGNGSTKFGLTFKQKGSLAMFDTFINSKINKESYKEIKTSKIEEDAYKMMNFVNDQRKNGKSDEEILNIFKKKFSNVKVSDELLKKFISKESYKESVTKFKCKFCGNSDPKQTIEIDGGLGYEAIICKKCGAFYDQYGSHKADNWSRKQMQTKENLTWQEKLIKFNESLSKDNIKKLLIKYGNNPNDVQKMVDKEFDNVIKMYGSQNITNAKAAEIIRSIYNESFKEKLKKWDLVSSSEMKKAFNDYEKETGKRATSLNNQNNFYSWLKNKGWEITINKESLKESLESNLHEYGFKLQKINNSIDGATHKIRVDNLKDEKLLLKTIRKTHVGDKFNNLNYGHFNKITSGQGDYIYITLESFKEKIKIIKMDDGGYAVNGTKGNNRDLVTTGFNNKMLQFFDTEDEAKKFVASLDKSWKEKLKNLKERLNNLKETYLYHIGQPVYYQGKKAIVADMENGRYYLWDITGKKALPGVSDTGAKDSEMSTRNKKESFKKSLDHDQTDVLEGVVVSNKNKPNEYILELLKDDNLFKGISDEDLLYYIQDTKATYKLESFKEKLENLKESFENPGVPKNDGTGPNPNCSKKEEFLTLDEVSYKSFGKDFKDLTEEEEKECNLIYSDFANKESYKEKLENLKENDEAKIKSMGLGCYKKGNIIICLDGDNRVFYHAKTGVILKKYGNKYYTKNKIIYDEIGNKITNKESIEITKEDIIKSFIKGGANKSAATKMTNKHYDDVMRIYKGQNLSVKKASELIQNFSLKESYKEKLENLKEKIENEDTLKILKKVAQKHNLKTKTDWRGTEIIMPNNYTVSITQKQQLGGNKGVMGGSSYNNVNSFNIVYGATVQYNNLKLKELEHLLDKFIIEELRNLEMTKKFANKESYKEKLENLKEFNSSIWKKDNKGIFKSGKWTMWLAVNNNIILSHPEHKNNEIIYKGKSSKDSGKMLQNALNCKPEDVFHPGWSWKYDNKKEFY